jgi:hypothetical protein
MGITLKEIIVHTTNNQWETEFFDRTAGGDTNGNKSVFKVLNIEKLGVYWRTKEENFITNDNEDEEACLAKMIEMLGHEDDLIT